jgi:CBS domain-containing protein
MSAPPVVVRSDAPIAAAAALIEERGVGGLPVVDPSGALVGVLSEVDLMRVHSVDYLWLNRRGLLVRHLMTAPAVSVHASTPVELAARRMERHRVRRLVVVADEDELRPIGVVTAGDLARAVGASARTPSTPAVAGEERRDA